MDYIITENCINCKNLICKTVCPTDCLVEGKNFLVIDKEKCISCKICLEECPSKSIVYKKKLKLNQNLFVIINNNLSKLWKNFKINKLKNLKFKHDEIKKKWCIVKNKLHLLKI